jgi:hypothetical protein
VRVRRYSAGDRSRDVFRQRYRAVWNTDRRSTSLPNTGGAVRTGDVAPPSQHSAASGTPDDDVRSTVIPKTALRSGMATKESLLELERQLWNADAEFYRQTLSEDVVMVFPEPTGILDRSAVLNSVGGADRWSAVEFDDERLVEVGDDSVQLVYRAVAERSEDESEYAALVSTTYVEAGGSWRVVSHQQTPVDG